MKILLTGILLLASASTGAQEIVTCVDEKGRKSIQDHPCGTRPSARPMTPAEIASGTIGAISVPMNEATQKAIRDMTARNEKMAKAANCDYLKAITESASARSNAGYKPKEQAAMGDLARERRARLKKECPGY